MQKKLTACPCCDCKYSSGSVTPNKWIITNVITHIKSKAKMELWRREFLGEKEMPHVKWLKKHAKVERVLSPLILIK